MEKGDGSQWFGGSSLVKTQGEIKIIKKNLKLIILSVFSK